MICPFPMEECNLKVFKKQANCFECAGDLDCQKTEIIKESKVKKQYDKGQMVLA